MNIQNEKFGVDLVTFSHPEYWGLNGVEEMVQLAEQDPKQFWVKMLDDISSTGVTGIELTFPPFDWRSASDAFDGVEPLKKALKERGLKVTSGFFASFERTPNIDNSSVRQMLFEEAKAYAQFLKACDADVLVVGCPLRQTLGSQPIEPFGFEKAKQIADFLNQFGILLHEYGVRLALHTEVSTVFAMPRDIQLLMMLTDPYYVHICPDSAHLLLAGGNPLEVIKQHKDRIAISHWKDACGVFPTSIVIDAGIHDEHKPYFREFGTGEVEFESWARELLNKRGRDWNILELDASPNPVKSIAHALKEVAGITYR